MPPSLTKYLLFIITLVCSLPVAALTNDSKEALNISADSSRHNYKIRETWFEGKVKIKQGSTHLTADRLVTRKNAHNKIEEVIAYGYQDLAHYWTQPKENEEVMHAQAKVMKIYPLKSRIVLEGEVLVTQGKNRFKGQIIVYNTKQQIITVPAAKNSRATFVIEADQVKKAI